MIVPHPVEPAGRRLSALLALLALVAPGVPGARADAVFLRGGEKLIGKVITEDAAKVVFESQTLGRLEIPCDRLERLERDPAPAPATATTTAVAPAVSPALTNQFLPWRAGPVPDDEFDWIQIKSGEWLKGHVKSLQEEKLEFDSEELNLLSFNWEDVLTLHSPRLHSIRFEAGKPVDGFVTVAAGRVRVATATATNTFPRAELLALTPTGNREVDKWAGKLSAGVSFRSGNTRETDVNVSATLQRRTPDTRLKLDYLGNYGKASGVQIEQNHRAIGQFDYFLSRRLYVRLPDTEYYRDPLQNLEHRLTLGAGVGYDLVKVPRAEWNVTLSPAWQRNWFGSVPAGQSRVADSVALVLATHLDVELTQRLDLIFEYRGQLTRDVSGNNTHHAVTTLEFEIHKRLKLDLSFIWDRITNPQTESGGSTPTPDDFRLVTSLGVDF